MPTYIASADGAFAIQSETFCSKVDKQVVPLGLVQTKVDEYKLSDKFFQFIFRKCLESQSYSHTMVAYKNLARNGPSSEVLGAIPTPLVLGTPLPVVPLSNIQAQLASLIQDCTKSPNFSESIGIELGIIKITPDSLMPEVQPQLTLSLTISGHPLLHVPKGAYQGYEIFRDCGDGKGFVHLQISLHPDFVDNSTLPAEGIAQIWRYKVIYYLKGEQVGNLSEIKSISVMWKE